VGRGRGRPAPQHRGVGARGRGPGSRRRTARAPRHSSRLKARPEARPSLHHRAARIMRGAGGLDIIIGGNARLGERCLPRRSKTGANANQGPMIVWFGRLVAVTPLIATLSLLATTVTAWAVDEIFLTTGARITG